MMKLTKEQKCQNIEKVNIGNLLMEKEFGTN